MKIIKKYEYKLTEETLEKDIDRFIRDAKKGVYQMDHRYGQEGLKLIKAYFRMIKEEFKNGNFDVSRECYKKLMFLLLQTEYNYFDYEDIVGRLNFEKFIANYFICLTKLCTTKELFNEYLDYLRVKEDYYFEQAEDTIINNLDNEQFAKFKKLLELEAENVKEKEYWKMDILTFLLEIAKRNRNKEEYDVLAQKFAPILQEEYRELIKEYEENEQ